MPDVSSPVMYSIRKLNINRRNIAISEVTKGKSGGRRSSASDSQPSTPPNHFSFTCFRSPQGTRVKEDIIAIRTFVSKEIESNILKFTLQDDPFVGPSLYNSYLLRMSFS